MATEEFRKAMIEAFESSRGPDLALSSLFIVRPGNVTNAEKVIIDIERYGEDVSPVVTPLEGPTRNTTDQFTTKEFIPPTLNEGSSIDVGQLLKRLPGMTEYQASDVGWMSHMVKIMLRNMRLMGDKISRNVEWQASQILQTGILQLTDAAGVLKYEINFAPKAAHFPTAGTAWDAGSPDMLGDIDSLTDVIRNNGLVDVDQLWFGHTSFDLFIKDTTVQAHYDNRRIDRGEIKPRNLGAGAKFQGVLDLGAYKYELITYSGRGILPGDSTSTKFLGPDKVVFLASGNDGGRATRLDQLFGGVPRAVPVDPRFAAFLPRTIAVPGAMSMSPNIYASQDGKQTHFDLESRPLLVPVGIDQFGCLDTGI